MKQARKSVRQPVEVLAGRVVRPAEAIQETERRKRSKAIAEAAVLRQLPRRRMTEAVTGMHPVGLDTAQLRMLLRRFEPVVVTVESPKTANAMIVLSFDDEVHAQEFMNYLRTHMRDTYEATIPSGNYVKVPLGGDYTSYIPALRPDEKRDLMLAFKKPLTPEQRRLKLKQLAGKLARQMHNIDGDGDEHL